MKNLLIGSIEKMAMRLIQDEQRSKHDLIMEYRGALLLLCSVNVITVMELDNYLNDFKTKLYKLNVGGSAVDAKCKTA